MPGIPLVAREISSYSRSTDQMCHEDSRMHLSAEEEIAAEESLTIYCKPVELYNILQRRARKTPLFIQRCLSYQIHEKHSRRIQMTLSLSETVNEGLQARCPFPLYILLGRLVSDTAVAEYSAVYRFSRACILTNFTGVEGSTQVQANFVLPEISRLALKTKSGTLAILLVNFAGNLNPSSGTDLSKGRLGMKSVPSNDGGYCLLGKIPLESLYRSWEKYPNLSLGQRAELTCPVDMHSCFLKLSCLNKDKCVSIQMPFSSGTSNFVQQVHITIFAEEVGGKDKSPYNSYRSSDVSSPSLSRILRLRAGNVVFNYRYYNNKLQRTEVTEDFSCPFCLVKCASFKGLRYHLRSSHDLFHFEFWVTEEYQAVNVSVKTDIWKSEIVADGIDPKQQTFFYCSKQRRHRRLRNLLQQSKHVHPLVLKSNLPSGVGENDVHNASIGAAECAHVPASFNVAGVSNAAAEACNDPECIQSISGNNFVPPSMLQFAKTRKLSIERSDSRNHTLLQKRQFFHSHRAQPMAWEQVEADRDSEDEVDDDVADLEDRRMLDDFVDVTKDEKQMMHMWNSFVRRQRVLADGHIPWACEAFTKLHGHDLVRAPSLIWCWRLFMMKLWNQGLLDARTMNTCNIILERYNKDKENDKDKDVSDPIPI